MGFLKSLKRWFNRTEAYGEFSSVNRGSLFASRERMAAVNKPILDQINEAEEVPVEGLPDAELDSHTSAQALGSREAAIEHERERRQDH